MKESYLIVGGDIRQEKLKDILEMKGKEVYHILYPADIKELDNAGRYSNIVLPIPLTKDGETLFSECDELKIKLSFLIDKLKDNQKIYGSGLMPHFNENGLDLMKDSVFKRANAVLTAQGALRLLLESTDDYIVTKKVLITGFGDVAETLADLLRRVGLRVHIKARSHKALLSAEMQGYGTSYLKYNENSLGEYDYIFSTVPSEIFGERDILSMKDEAIFFELASYPYSADRNLFIKYNKKYVSGSALPGKYLPTASAKLIADFIL